MDKNKSVQMIFLKDMVFAALYWWKQILLAVLCFALLGAAVAMIAKQDYPQVYDQYKTQITEANLQVDEAQRELDAHNLYLDESILMRLSPYGYYYGTLSLYVAAPFDATIGEVDKTGHVLNSYSTFITSNSCMQAIADKLQTKPEHISEILSVSCDVSSATLQARIRCLTEEDASNALSIIRSTLDNAYNDVNETVTSHQSSVLVSSVSLKADSSITSTQQAQQTQLTNLTKKLNTAKDAAKAIVAPAAPSTVKYVVISAFGGAFLIAFLAIMLHILSDKVYSARTMRNRTGVKTMGIVSDTRKNALLRKLEGRNMQIGTAQIEVIAACISNRLDSRKLLITGTIDSSVSQELAEVLSQNGKSVCVYTDLLSSNDAMTQLGLCDAVVLVEKCNKSRYADVESAAEIICDSGKELMGCVLING